MLKNLIKKNLKTYYVNSFLGISWAIFIPLILMFVLSFVFENVLKIEIENFSLFVLSGLIPFMFFSATLTQTTNSIVENAYLLRQFNLPKEIIPLSLILTNFLNFLLGLLVLIPIFIFSKLSVFYPLFFLLFVIPIFLIFVIGIGLFFSSLNVFFRDISHLLGILIMFLFWITPIFYKTEMVPIHYRWIVNFNPLNLYINLFRDILLDGKIPKVKFISLSLAWAVLSFFIGYSFFLKTESKFLKRI
ncbi:MAG: ABC transporter permease [Candidatus Omnitrophica bacterium]|nr:ABC transporter permease [Candidatus Omnitrophota bacterium]